jgi:hypothetical protein
MLRLAELNAKAPNCITPEDMAAAIECTRPLDSHTSLEFCDIVRGVTRGLALGYEAVLVDAGGIVNLLTVMSQWLDNQSIVFSSCVALHAIARAGSERAKATISGFRGITYMLHESVRSGFSREPYSGRDYAADTIRQLGLSNLVCARKVTSVSYCS